MYDQLYAHVNPLLSPAQSGFRKGDSTEWQLARFTQNLLERRHQHNFSLVCFFDLSKAFDTVWHRGLLAKVASFNIGGNVLRWLESYLSCRVQQVRVSGSLSQPLEVCSGVPQGSILGPLLFLLYVNDLKLAFQIPPCTPMILLLWHLNFPCPWRVILCSRKFAQWLNGCVSGNFDLMLERLSYCAFHLIRVPIFPTSTSTYSTSLTTGRPSQLLATTNTLESSLTQA